MKAYEQRGGRRISWADQVGRPLTRCCLFDIDLPAGSSGSRDGVVTKDLRGRGGKDQQAKRARSSPMELREKRSYKEALLHPVLRSGVPSFSKQREFGHSSVRRAWNNNCFRCLASDHWARDYRDPVRCTRYRRTGHYVSLSGHYEENDAESG